LKKLSNFSALGLYMVQKGFERLKREMKDDERKAGTDMRHDELSEPRMNGAGALSAATGTSPAPDEVRVIWDEQKNQANQKEHEISFEEAATVFYDPLEVTVDDPAHSYSEHRFWTVGQSSGGRLIVLSYTERSSTIRIISARKPEPSERRDYESGRL
jgi:uncharacterized DUF497 family protein